MDRTACPADRTDVASLDTTKLCFLPARRRSVSPSGPGPPRGAGAGGSRPVPARAEASRLPRRHAPSQAESSLLDGDPVHLMLMLEPKQILEAALALEPTERAQLAKEILDSLDEPVTVEPELAADIQRRIHEIESGAVKAIPWAEVKARIASRRRAR